MAQEAAQTLSKEHQELVVKQYEAVKAVAEARASLVNARLQLARAGASHLIALDW